MKNRKQIVMLGTRFDTMGGISAVVNEYRNVGLFKRLPITYLATHCDGSRLQKIRVCAVSWCRYIGLLLRGRVACTHVHAASRASFWRKSLFLFPAFLFRVRTVFHLHGGGFSSFYDDNRNSLTGWVIRYVLNHADRVVVLSQSWKRWVQSVSHNPHVQVINNPVQLPAAGTSNRREPASILFLGKLTRSKGVYDLLTATASLIPDHPDLQLLLCGDGELEQARDMARQLGIQCHVQVLGWVGGPEKSALLQRATVFVLPSYAEGLPMSVLEAMAAGLPVVSTSVGGLPELIADGQTGHLIQPGDVAALAESLDRLLSDKDLRQRISKAAYSKIESAFSIDCVLEQIEGLYRDLAPISN